MAGQHETDLAPRDVVAKAMLRRMRETGTEHVWLMVGRSASKMAGPVSDYLRDMTGLGIDPVHG
jgi:L-aspartate oxidase